MKTIEQILYDNTKHEPDKNGFVGQSYHYDGIIKAMIEYAKQLQEQQIINCSEMFNNSNKMLENQMKLVCKQADRVIK